MNKLVLRFLKDTSIAAAIDANIAVVNSLGTQLNNTLTNVSTALK